MQDVVVVHLETLDKVYYTSVSRVSTLVHNYSPQTEMASTKPQTAAVCIVVR
jgi:hypothetical protein